MSHPTPLSKLPNFDPRQVPVTGVDAHLPAVPVDALT
ncbi:MAG TPA: coenzyme A pyrophosphatase, partial [Ottowia sp.]|nr:coenzyme A pyrophosphatase [Ottowia sp.]